MASREKYYNERGCSVDCVKVCWSEVDDYFTRNNSLKLWFIVYIIIKGTLKRH